MEVNKMKILVAEDDPVSYHVLRKILEYWNHDVKAVKDGAQALQLIKKQWKPDILLTDWIMPRMSGPDLIKELRSDPQFRDMYIIMLTAKDQMDDMVDGFISGVDDYISKPVSESELKNAIENGKTFLMSDGSYIDRSELIEKNILKFKEKFHIR